MRKDRFPGNGPGAVFFLSSEEALGRGKWRGEIAWLGWTWGMVFNHIDITVFTYIMKSARD